MAMSPSDLDLVRLWCRERVPPERWDIERAEAVITGRHIDLVWVRASPDGEPSRAPFARLRYLGPTRLWLLYWRDAEGSFHRYRHLAPSGAVTDLLDFLARGREPLFWL